MIRATLVFLTLASAIFFPWPFTALLALGASFLEPLTPLAAGIFIDTLYYSASTGGFPYFALCGALATVIVFFVRNQLKASTIWK